MANWLFVAGLALFLTPLYLWSFKALPRERWQIMCTIPVKKALGGSWEGLNLTYYGLFNALALAAGVILFAQTMALGMFLRTGRSQVTGAGITFHVHQDRI